MRKLSINQERKKSVFECNHITRDLREEEVKIIRDFGVSKKVIRDSNFLMNSLQYLEFVS